jgi:hypothetical protein
MERDDRTPALWLTLIYTLALGVFAAACRLLPYYVFDPLSGDTWNLAPVGGLALFVGSRLRSRWAYLVPLGAMLVSDLLLIRPLAAMGLPSMGWGTPLIYASFAVYVLIGRWIRPGELPPLKIGGAVLLGSVQFFLVTNFACWPGNPRFPQTLDGLLLCYAQGLPFYRPTLVSDLIFSCAFFGLHAALLHLVEKGKAGQPA